MLAAGPSVCEARRGVGLGELHACAWRNERGRQMLLADGARRRTDARGETDECAGDAVAKVRVRPHPCRRGGAVNCRLSLSIVVARRGVRGGTDGCAHRICAAARRGGCARAGAAVFSHRRRNDGAIDGRAQWDRREAFSGSLRRSRRDERGMRMGGGSDSYGEMYGCVHYVEWIVGLSTTRSGIPVASARCKRMAQRESRTADMNQTVLSKSASLCLCENGHGIHMAQMRRCRRSS